MDWKKAGNYALYAVPGYGVYDQLFKKHKGERSAAGIIFSSIYTAGLVIKLALLPAYVSKGVSTGNWHPFRFNEKEKTEQIEKISRKQKNLEKNVDYEELLR